MFDPVPEYIEYIKNKVKNKPNLIKFNNYGLGSKEEDKIFHYRYGSIMRRDIERFHNMHDSYSIHIHTLDNYCSDNNIEHIDYLKIDTEGYDFEVIKGASEMINKIRFIQFEDFNVFYNGETIDDIFHYFRKWNIYMIGGKPCNYLVTKETVDLPKVN
jgi:FkbM family methyltransferase